MTTILFRRGERGRILKYLSGESILAGRSCESKTPAMFTTWKTPDNFKPYKSKMEDEIWNT